MFAKILVPTDGSAYSLHAAAIAADIARKYGADVSVLLVTDYSQLNSTPWPPLAYKAIKEMLDQQYATILEATLDVFRREAVETRSHQAEGNPEEIIKDLVEEEAFDLIVMGSYGLHASPDQPYYLGSVTERVLRLVTCPVLTVQR